MSMTLRQAWPRQPESAGIVPITLLHHAFEATVAAYPEAIAVVSPERSFTYRDLDRAANRLARKLREIGVGRGDHVGIFLPRSAQVYVALLAILKAGAAYVPVDADAPADRLRYILDDCQATALISVPAFSDRTTGYQGPILAPEVGQETDESPIRETDATSADVCYVIYTSGTTGRPKGVQIEHRNACHLVRAEEEIFEVGPDDRVFQGFSLAFDASVEEIWLAFASGAALVVGSKDDLRSGRGLAETLTRNGVTVFSTVPTMLSLVEDDLPTVRLLILGGEPCPIDLVNRWKTPGRRLVNTYGPTEATVIATFADCEPGRPVTIGRAIPGYSIALLDEALRAVPFGEPGEICIGGAGVARGYVGLPALTREKFIADPLAQPGDRDARLYRSGDLGRYNASGEIEFLGRIDAQVKLRGFRIELAEIESVLREDPAVLASAVALREDRPGLPQLVAYVVPSGHQSLDPRSLLATLRKRLPAYMIPARLETIDALPTLPSGKVDRGRLPAPRAIDPQDAEEASASIIGRNNLERAIASVWVPLFAPLPVSLDDDFFRDLGGHSLLAARLVSDLRCNHNLPEVSVLDVYNHPSIALLAARIQEPSVTSPLEANPVNGIRLRSTNAGFFRFGLAQFFALYLVIGFYSLQWLTPYLSYSWMIEAGVTIPTALLVALSTLLAVYPVMLAVSIAVKWLVVGRFRAGEYPLWGMQHFKIWFVHAIHACVPVNFLAGTPLLSWYYRLNGASIGANVHLGSDTLRAFDLITIGENTCLGADTEVAGFSVEGGRLRVGAVAIGRGCFVGNRAVIREGAVMEDGSKLEDLSLLPAGGTIPRGLRYAGSPARPVAGPPPVAANPAPGLARRFALGLAQTGAQFLFPVMVISAIFPGVIVLNTSQLPPWILYLTVAPCVALSFVVLLCLEIAAVKWLLLGRVTEGSYDLHGAFILRKWFVDQLMAMSLDVVGSLYATIYLNPWYRLLGARLGHRAEVSTASFLSPDLLTVGDEGFIADAVSLGAARVEDGRVHVGSVRVGRRAFIGNSALLPPGADIGENSLIGCLSMPPGPSGASPAGSAWLGSPAVFLPMRQESKAFDEERTYAPTRWLILQRALIEFLRVTLPLTLFLILTSELLAATLRLHRSGLSNALLILGFPLFYAVAGVAACLIVAALKWLIVSRYRPAEYPLWSLQVWRSELVTALFENLARPFLLNLLEGTPFLAWFVRLLGAKIGERVYLGSSEMTEFDLISIGDEAALNVDCTIQTHLFEDRVMKMSTVQIGPRCDVGSQAVVLYDTEMREGSSLDSLSLLMKGEVLPAGTRWQGSPARASRTESH